LTIPALITNIGEQQYLAGIKKGMNTLAEAAQLNKVMLGFDYADLNTTTSSIDENTYSLYSLLGLRTNIDTKRSGVNGTAPKVSAQAADGNQAIYFNDGTALIYTPSATTSDDARGDKGFPAVYDTNGDKGPNILSNCAYNTSATVDTATYTQCNDKTKRFIRDQFSIRLKGATVLPNGSAARWALVN